MRKIYLLILAASLSASAQTFQWVCTPEIDLTLNPELVGYCTAVDGSNNVYLSGYEDNAYSYNYIFAKAIKIVKRSR